MNLLLYRTFAAVSVVIVLYAVIHGILAGVPSARVHAQFHVAYLCLIGAGHFICRQREVDWRERPDKLRKLGLARKLLWVGFATGVVLLGLDWHDHFSGASLGM